MRKQVEIKYSDFPDIKEQQIPTKEQILGISQTGKKMTIKNLSLYLKITATPIRTALEELEMEGFVKSHIALVPCKNGSLRQQKVYEKK